MNHMINNEQYALELCLHNLGNEINKLTDRTNQLGSVDAVSLRYYASQLFELASKVDPLYQNQVSDVTLERVGNMTFRV